jgi:hypothetical protein
MAHLVLDVPFVSQLGFGDPTNPRDDPTGCWYASACMVGNFFEAGPRLGAPQFYKPGLGVDARGRRIAGHQALQITDYPVLMKNEDLVPAPRPASETWTTGALAGLLRQYGPLMVVWTKSLNGQRYGHASVIVGVIQAFWWPFEESILRRAGPAFQRTYNPAAGTQPPAPKPKLPVDVHTPPLG